MPGAAGVRRAAAALFLALFAAGAWTSRPVEYDNSLSRLFLLSAAVDLGRLDLGPYAGETVDASTRGGRTYSNKAIGLPLLTAPAYAAARALTGDPPLSPRLRKLAELWGASLPFAACGPLVFLLARRLGAADRDAYLAAAAGGLGTILWIHGGTFSGHAAAALLVLAAFAVEAPAGSGALAGLAVLTDYMALPPAAALLWRAWDARGGRGAALFAGGGALALLPLLAYNALCFGSPLRLSYAALARPEFAAGASRGALGVSLPRPGAALSLLLSPSRGLFFVMPWLLMALPGLKALRRSHPRQAAAIAASALGVLAMNAGFYGWHGGWTFGPRYLACVLPLLSVAASRALDRRWFPPLAALSFLQVGTAVATTPYVSEWVRNPIMDTMLPVARAGLFAASPASMLLLAAAAGGLLAWGLPRAAPAPARGPSSPLYAAAAAWTVLGLALLRSDPALKIPQFNARLLRDAASARSAPIGLSPAP